MDTIYGLDIYSREEMGRMTNFDRDTVWATYCKFEDENRLTRKARDIVRVLGCADKPSDGKHKLRYIDPKSELEIVVAPDNAGFVEFDHVDVLANEILVLRMPIIFRPGEWIVRLLNLYESVEKLQRSLREQELKKELAEQIDRMCL